MKEEEEEQSIERRKSIKMKNDEGIHLSTPNTACLRRFIKPDLDGKCFSCCHRGGEWKTSGSDVITVGRVQVAPGKETDKTFI